MLVLIVPVPGHCLLITFSRHNKCTLKICMKKFDGLLSKWQPCEFRQFP